MIHQEIGLDEKWVCTITPIIFEPFFSVCIVVTSPINVTPIVGPSDTNISVYESLVMAS